MVCPNCGWSEGNAVAKKQQSDKDYYLEFWGYTLGTPEAEQAWKEKQEMIYTCECRPPKIFYIDQLGNGRQIPEITRHPGYTIEKVCPTCERTFYSNLSDERRGKGTFCCYQCYWKSLEKDVMAQC